VKVLERIRIDAERPNRRKIMHAARLAERGALLIVPTETTYVFACRAQAASALNAVRRLRRLDDRHRFSLLCRDLQQAGQLAAIDDAAFRLMRRLVPGGYTFILPAASTLPKRLFGKRREIGIRISAHRVVQMLLDALGEPLVASTLIFAGEDAPAYDPEVFWPRLRGEHVALLDAGLGGVVPTTVVDLTEGEPRCTRLGAAPWPA